MPFINNFTVYYTIDTAEDNPIYKEDSTFLSRVQNFIENNLASLLSGDANRHYLKKDGTTQVVHNINQLLSSANHTDKLPYALTIAKRLLEKEKVAQSRIEHLDREVQKGGLIFTYFTLDNEEYICLLKIHYIDYYEEETFEESRGLPKKNVILKTCVNKLASNQLSDNFYLSDSTKQKGEASARFWWDDFLELKSVFSDKDNTKKSFTKVESLLKKEFWDTSRDDYWDLRNNLITYYRTTPQFNIDDMITMTLGQFNLTILDNATPEEKQAYKTRLTNQMLILSQDNNGQRLFDTQFDIDPKEVKARAKRQIKLMENVDLSIKGEIADFRGKIIAEMDTNQRKYLKIYTNEGYDEFKN